MYRIDKVSMCAEDEKNHYSKKKLLQYLNLDLFIDDMIEIDRHLSNCARCQKLLIKLEPISNRSAGDAVFEDFENKRRITKPKPSRYSLRFVMGLIGVFISGVSFFLSYHFLDNDLDDHLSENETSVNAVIVESVHHDNDTIHNDKDIRMNAEAVSIVHAALRKRQSERTSAQKLSMTKHLPDRDKKTSGPEKDSAKAPLELVEESEKVIPSSRDTSIRHLENKSKKGSPENMEGKGSKHSTESNENTVENIAVKPVQSIRWHIDVSLEDNESPQPATGIEGIRELVRKKIEYPADSLANKMKSNSVIEFRVNDDGSLEKFKVLESVGYKYEEKLIEILKNGPEWRPFVSPEFVKYDVVKITFTLSTN